MILRDYQQQAVDSALEALVKHPATLATCPTGGGKTIIFAELINRFLPRGRVMVLAHREELLDQARDKIRAVTGIYPDLEMADSRAGNGLFKAPIIVSSIQTQTSGQNGNRRMNRFDPHEFSLLVCDEAHHCPADTCRETVSYYRQNPALRVFGCTATPDRHDEKALGEIFDSVCFEYGIVDAIQDGWLVPITQKYLSVIIDLGGMHYTLGDFNGRELRELLAQGSTLEKIASDSVQYATDRRTLVFADSVQNAETLTREYNRHRLGAARIVTGETPKEERRALIAAYRTGAFQWLVNVGVATEGFDVPEIACIVMARPTCSRALYAQMAGRGGRVLGGLVDGLPDATARRAAIAASPKPDCLILDLVGNSAKHKLITAADILGGEYSDDTVARAEKAMRELGVPCDVAEELEKAERRRNADIQAEAARLDRLRLQGKSRATNVDPFAVMGIAPRERRGWESDKPADAEQIAKLDKWGILKDFKEPTSRQAAQLIHEFQMRVRRNLATYKQTKCLTRLWEMPPEQARITPYAEAGRIMQILADNNWRRPAGAK